MIWSLWVFVTLFVASGLITALVLKLLAKHQVIDIPNARSSHNQPTPRGGGIALAALIGLATLVAAEITQEFALAVLGASVLLITSVGFVDDLRGLSAKTRLIAQLLAATALTASIPLDSVASFVELPLMLLYPLSVLFIVWLTNLYNFMDGIDGIAGVQAVLLGTAVYGMALIGIYPGHYPWAAGLIAVCAGGFLLFNFPPAKVFMGDSGSVSLGFFAGSMILLETAHAPNTLWVWLILLSGFAVDASVTLTVRLVRGKRIYQAHRNHLYQLWTRHREFNLIEQDQAPEKARTRAHRGYLSLFTLSFCLIQLPLAFACALGYFPGATVTCALYSVYALAFAVLGAGADRFLPYWQKSADSH